MGFKPWKIVEVVADELVGSFSLESLAASVGLGVATGPVGMVAGVVAGAEDGSLVRDTAELAFDATLTTLRIGEEVWTRVNDDWAPLVASNALVLFSRVGVPGLLIAGPGGFVAGAYLFSKSGELIEMGLVKLADFLGAFETRLMTDNEWSFVSTLFGGTLPPRSNIHITNVGLFDKTDGSTRAFVLPLFKGNYLVNFGSIYHHHADLAAAEPGLFAHEITHVWQSKRRPLKVTIYAEALASSEYDFPLGRQWRTYNLEQQASIVEQWVDEGQSRGSPLYRYIAANVRAGNDRANSHQFFNMDTGRGIRELFNACSHLADARGLGALLPNLHHVYTPRSSASGTVTSAAARFGTLQFALGAVDWVDLPLRLFGASGSRDTPRGLRERLNGLADWSVEQGYVGGCPNFHESTYDGRRVAGVYLFDSSVAEFRDLRSTDLPAIESTRDTARGIVTRFNAVHDYAVANGFVGGFPTLHETRDGRFGAVLIRSGAATWMDCDFTDLILASGW
ncbi:MAG: hypothetical protein AAF467_24685 [Actinomycetota bacterium]